MVEVRKQSWINVDRIQVICWKLDKFVDGHDARKDISKIYTTFRYEEVRDKAVVGGLQYCDL